MTGLQNVSLRNRTGPLLQAMLAFIIRRILIVIPTLLGVTIIVFLMLRITPGDPA